MNRVFCILIIGFGMSSLLAQELPQAENIQRAPEEMRVLAQDIDRLLEDDQVIFLDVREPEELEALGTKPGYINIPLGQLEERLDELPKDKAILTACNGGNRASQAAAILIEHGFQSAGFCGLRDYQGQRTYVEVQD